MGTRVTILLAITLAATALHAQTLLVPGSSDPWLAGMPDGSTASLEDVAPAQSPVLLLGITISGGLAYSFKASGGVRHGPSYPFFGPDGNADQVYPHATGAQNGIATLTSPLNALIGVFLGPTQPNLGVAPAGLDFTTQAGRDYPTLSPLLQQPFFIGDGVASLGVLQQVIAPAGATRLFLGTMDGYGWHNNEGEFMVTVVPEPRAAVLVMLCACLARVAWRLKRQGDHVGA